MNSSIIKRRDCLKKKILITAFLILLIFSLFLFRTYKFTSLQVVESHFGKDNITKVFSEIKRDWGQLI